MMIAIKGSWIGTVQRLNPRKIRETPSYALGIGLDADFVAIGFVRHGLAADIGMISTLPSAFYGLGE